MNIFQPILLFDSFILPADIIFYYFPQSIKSDISYSSTHQKSGLLQTMHTDFLAKMQWLLYWKHSVK